MREVHYVANLHRIGAIPQETIVTLLEYAKLKSWAGVKRSILKKNLLLKQSKERNITIINEVKARFDISNPSLPHIGSTTLYLSKIDSFIVKKQIIMIYFLNKELLANQLIKNYLIPYIENHYNPELSKDLALSWLELETKSHYELVNWSLTVKDRWIGNFVSALRKFDYLKPHPQKRVEIPRIRLETFAFFFLYNLYQNKSLKDINELEFWKYFSINDSVWNELLYGLETKHWITREQFDDNKNINYYYNSFNEWIINDMG